MNNLDDIYKEFGNNFCLCPFLGTFYSTVTVAKTKEDSVSQVLPCALLVDCPEFVIYDNNILKSLNEPHWIELRKNFVDGKFHQIKQCQKCIKEEKNGGHSPRIGSAKHLVDQTSIDIIQEVKKIINNGYRVDKVRTLDYFPSNYCNYSCIMCYGSASSQRHTFEIKIKNSQNKIHLSSLSDDFFDILKDVELINFTGGETVLQDQVLDIIDYLIQEDLSQNITIFLLTNGSSFPEKLEQKFKKFKRVVYMVSIDGIGAVGEYQRRNSGDCKRISSKIISTQ
jgi:uncharacterized radical SAM superfamily Fe-S cluster-containing enzyme